MNNAKLNFDINFAKYLYIDRGLNMYDFLKLKDAIKIFLINHCFQFGENEYPEIDRADLFNRILNHEEIYENEKLLINNFEDGSYFDVLHNAAFLILDFIHLGVIDFDSGELYDYK